MSDHRRWTGARLRAFMAFFATGRAFVSNHTDFNPELRVDGIIYWQSANWLRDEGLTEAVEGHHWRQQLTDDGRSLLNAFVKAGKGVPFGIPSSWASAALS